MHDTPGRLAPAGPILAKSSQEGLVAPIDFILLVPYGLGAIVTPLPGVLFLVLPIAAPRARSQPATSMVLPVLLFRGVALVAGGAVLGRIVT
ncbi:hypothetical protein [Palleronia abyssalis]|uniref:Uncharacterized protein n=1 Tax=Palleronia abyssalis TaxID=1501240 RepID=A0A2R8C0N8_9RHOB|nr:hypothetical protein [Palleronia abyssalis]SPJ25964.1 hypothetical protein PAA8504_03820 [Palleronia abyssalis]